MGSDRILVWWASNLLVSGGLDTLVVALIWEIPLAVNSMDLTKNPNRALDDLLPCISFCKLAPYI